MNVTTVRAWCYHCNREVGASVLNDIRQQMSKQKSNNFGETIRPNGDTNSEYLAKASDPIKSNPMKNYERRDYSKWNLYIRFCWLLTTTNKE